MMLGFRELVLGASPCDGLGVRWENPWELPLMLDCMMVIH